MLHGKSDSRECHGEIFDFLRDFGHNVHSHWPWDSHLRGEVTIFASSSFFFFCVSFLSLSQEQLKRVTPKKHWKVLGVRWSFQFKTDCFLIIVRFFTFQVFLYSDIRRGELKEMDKTVSWTSPRFYCPLQIES